MPSAKVLEEKKKIVSDIKELINGAAGGVIVNYQGITVEQDTKMRAELRKAGVNYFVAKNTLLKMAADECGLEDLAPVYENMTSIAIGKDDAVAPAKILCGYAEKIPTFTIKAGFLDGKVISIDEVENLSKLPSKDQLIANLMSVLNGNIRGLAYVIKAIADKQSEGAEPAAAGEEAVPAAAEA